MAVLERVASSWASLSAGAYLWLVVLTTRRSGEVRLAKSDEIRCEATERRISGSRMEAGIEHRVPLTDAALAVLDRIPLSPRRIGSELSVSGSP